MLKFLLKLLRGESITADELFEVLSFIASKTKIEVDDIIVAKLREIYKKNPELIINIITLLLALVADKENTIYTETKEEVEVKEEKEEVKEEEVKKVSPEENSKAKTEKDVNDILKSLFS